MIPEPSMSLRAVPSGEIYIKSRRTRQRFMGILIANIEAALTAAGAGAQVRRHGNHELSITGPDLDAAATAVAAVFGIERVDRVVEIAADSLESLAEAVAAVAGARVAGKTFAVRVRRHGNHAWTSQEAQAFIGSRLFDASAGVDLTNPEVTVRVRVEQNRAIVVEASRPGPAGLPVGTQERTLVLLSGGIDSPVAGWMMMRRGCPIDLLHFQLECNQADHALAVGHGLVARWGWGAEVRMHVIDFEPIKKELIARTHPRLRQVLLKQLMLEAARRVAEQVDIPLIVTGDSLGQVSSQTAANLVEIDRYAAAPVLRPLIAFRKVEIIDWARRIGTYELSIKAREVCDLSEGHPVETAAPTGRLQAGMRRLRPGLVEDALATRESVLAADWFPGVPLEAAGEAPTP